MSSPYWEPLAAAPPIGATIAYNERATPLTLSGTYVDAFSVTFTADGVTAYWLEAYWPSMTTAAGNQAAMKAVIDGVDAGLFWLCNPNAGFGPVFGRRRLPGLGAGSHTIKVQAAAFGGATPTLQAGDGTGVNYTAAFMRVTA